MAMEDEGGLGHSLAVECRAQVLCFISQAMLGNEPTQQDHLPFTTQRLRGNHGLWRGGSGEKGAG